MNVITDSPVGLPNRVFAVIIDSVFLLIITFPVLLLFDFHLLIVFSVLSLLYNTLTPYFWNGYTIGKRLVGIRIAMISGEKLSLLTMFIREPFSSILYNATIGILTIVSAVFIAQRDDHRAIHDLIASTYVTYDPPQ
ncbi:RDD family protein [Gracilibacillus massiliensis]|uniref:RDD family protein n=1 Tax=Gracilibacillus massiliensis TaxID=1564956 RepID=UPI00071D81E7|nr:RDD family protein [Gracilibacillus massiliensis]